MLHKKNFQLNSKTHLRLQQHRKMSFHRTHVWMDIYLYQSTPDLCLGCSKYGSCFHRSHKSPAHLQSIVSRLSSHHKVSHSGKILKIHRPRKSTKTSLKVSSTKKCWEFSDHNTTSLWYTQEGRWGHEPLLLLVGRPELYSMACPQRAGITAEHRLLLSSYQLGPLPVFIFEINKAQWVELKSLKQDSYKQRASCTTAF